MKFIVKKIQLRYNGRDTLVVGTLKSDWVEWANLFLRITLIAAGAAVRLTSVPQSYSWIDGMATGIAVCMALSLLIWPVHILKSGAASFVRQDRIWRHYPTLEKAHRRVARQLSDLEDKQQALKKLAKR